MGKLLFCSGEGLGNTIQCIPAIRTLKEALGHDIDFWHAYGAFKIPGRLIPYVDKWIVGSQISNIDDRDYDGAVTTLWTQSAMGRGPLLKLPVFNTTEPRLSMERSEVDTYMDIARQLGAEEDKILWWGRCNSGETDEKYDVVIHDGYNSHSPMDWSVKSYPHYEKVVEHLEGLKICSVGSKQEYVKGTDDKTGLNLPDSLALIKNCRIFLGNDSGLYHCANALEVDNIVIFTATSVDKNYDERFHKYSTIICRDDLECRTDCQKKSGWKKECGLWKCRDIDPEVVLGSVKQKIILRFMSDASEAHDKDG